MLKHPTRSLLFLVLFAGLAVLARELPECAALADDVSNDGNVPTFLVEELICKVSLATGGSTDFSTCASRPLGTAAQAPRFKGKARFSSCLSSIPLSLFQVQRE